MVRFAKAMLLIQFCLSLSGCAQLPEYARPHLLAIDAKPHERRQAVTYRQLTADDFQAAELPARMAPHEKTIGAHTCCSIRLTEDSKLAITRGHINGRPYYFGSMKQIAFEAVVDPECSWLNPDLSGEKLDYVLAHEQIHFALMEIAARRLTREAREEAKKFISIQPTRAGARAAIADKIRDMAAAANRAVLKEHTAFDEDTSLFFDPGGQRRWMDRVTERLSETGLN